jgi:hypothetical protein
MCATSATLLQALLLLVAVLSLPLSLRLPLPMSMLFLLLVVVALPLALEGAAKSQVSVVCCSLYWLLRSQLISYPLLCLQYSHRAALKP